MGKDILYNTNNRIVPLLLLTKLLFNNVKQLTYLSNDTQFRGPLTIFTPFKLILLF